MPPIVKPFDYVREVEAHESELLEAVRRVLRSGSLLLGPETEALETELAEWLGAKHCVAVASGTMALQLSLMALGVRPGDEVVSVANTCSPTMMSALMLGCRPVFVDVDPRTLMMDPARLEEAIGERTRAVVPVHLWGQTPDVDAVMEVAARRDVPVIEDCAQSFGTKWKGRDTGTFGAFGCFSFYPTKNLGSYGDAGAIVAEDADRAARLRRLRMYGYGDRAVSEEAGANGRISEMQAAIVRWKLGRVDAALARRREIAAEYRKRIENSDVKLPVALEACEPSWHQFVVRSQKREALRQHLADRDIVALIHYPVPLHRMPAYAGAKCHPEELSATVAACDEVLSLPVHENLRDDEVERVIEAVNSFGG